MKPHRPKKSDPRILNSVAYAISHEIQKWAYNLTVEDIQQDLLIAIQENEDGYQIAKELENLGYSPDSDLVEILSKVSVTKNKVYNQLCREWLIDNQIQEPKINGEVKSKDRPEYGTGIVVSNIPEGKSSVSFANLVGVLTLNWEDLEIL